MIRNVLCAAALASLSATAFAQGTAFSYQGQLNAGSNSVENLVDVRYSLFDAAVAGSEVGTSITVLNTAYEDGVINAELDFGAVFGGAPRFLQIDVANPAGSGFTPLGGRVAILPVPYAQYSATAGVAESAGIADDVVGGIDDADASPTNELQTLGGTGSQITISGVPSSRRISGLSASDGNPTEVVSVDELGNITISAPIFLQAPGTTEELVDQVQVSINAAQTEPDLIQSFTPNISGALTSIDVRFSSGSSATTGNLIIYDGSGTGGTELANQPYVPGASTGVVNYELSPAPDVTAGQVYTFRFEQTSGGSQSFSVRTGSNPYADGELLSSGPNDDAVFRTYVTPPASGGGIEFPDMSVQTTAYPGVAKVAPSAPLMVGAPIAPNSVLPQSIAVTDAAPGDIGVVNVSGTPLPAGVIITNVRVAVDLISWDLANIGAAPSPAPFSYSVNAAAIK